MSADGWLERQREHYDARADAYASLFGRETPYHDAMTARFLGLAGARSGQQVLDVGCGPGRTTIPLLRTGCIVTALDVSEATLDRLTARVRELGLAEHFRPVCAPAESLREDSRYDLVVGRGLLHHLARPSVVLDRVRHALAPSGTAAFMDPNPFQPAWIGAITLHPAVSWSQEYRYLRHAPSYSRRIFRAAGFENVQLFSVGLVPPPLWGRLSGMQQLEDKLATLPLLKELAAYHLVVAQR